MKELPKKYDSDKVEGKWQEKWSEMDVYKYDPESDKPTYSIDTPPPYVSGDLHVGHAMSYTQAEFVARYKRMQGYNVFYPMGFDDNGLPTERYVERELGIDKENYERSEFVEICRDTTKKGRENYRNVWTRLGISVDWDLLYTTINEKCRRVGQRSFMDLYDKEKVYKQKDPVIWCPECKTAIAQADLEDEEFDSEILNINFPLINEEDRESVEIATTRPELLPACVAVFVHPDDERYQDLVGKKAKVPIFGQEVPIETDHKVDKDFGSGVVMVCTFGDKTDIEWWKEHDLPLRLAINKDGTLNERGENYEGMEMKEARKEIKWDLNQEGYLESQENLTHAVQIHERCDNPVEYYIEDQWFVEMLNIKDELKDRASEIDWFPDYMEKRFDEWVDGLKWDWCLSRQRFYGVPFPVWYCDNCDEIFLAKEKNLPVDPTVDDPPHEKCPECGSEKVEAEEDVMDTWFISSLSPLINSNWGEENSRMDEIYPMSLRPQGYDIIRTWAFYTVLKSHLHTESKPWDDIMLSGMGLAEKGKSFSKSKGIVVKPLDMVDKYSADALRWWSSSVKLGEDLIFSEKDLVAGEKLIDKLWNASRFVQQFLPEEVEKPNDDELETIDKWILQKMDKAIEESTRGFETYEYDKSKHITKEFFWHDFCDNYLEIVKQRLYGDSPEESKKAGEYVLYKVLINSLKLLAPIMPHVTEEIYYKIFKDREREKGNDFESIHVSRWPEKIDIGKKRILDLGNLAVDAISLLRKYKSKRDLALNSELGKVEIYIDEKIEDYGLNETISRAMKIENLEISHQKPELEREVTDVDLNYAKVGPKYGSKVKDIEKSIENNEFEMKENKLKFRSGEEDITLEEEEFQTEEEYSIQGKKGEIIQGDELVIRIIK